MGRKSLNIWPALSDMMFMFFIASLVAAYSFSEKNEELLEANEDLSLLDNLKETLILLEAENQRLQEELERERAKREALEGDQVRCGGTGEFIDAFTTCVEQRTRKKLPRSEDPCSVTVGEDLVRFQTAKSRPISADGSEQNARHLAACLYQELDELDQATFHNIQYIYIDGHTDCDGGRFSEWNNMELGLERAFYLYDQFYIQAKTSPKRYQLMPRIIVRSFGESAPVDGSSCQGSNRKSPEDRRVTISVQPRIDRSSP